ncbi:hypothetical protein DV515_00018608 [Chloebia gouldiae]|uniref:Disintegrin domain-containing protein n=1 Tax=Chloebia gouldiae TaxID=44316 RepID=A0A3L8Q7A7_CHLGU|nr:hypothetical protein DV515_00018608 [Chloebia gouldiae]
MEPLPTELSSPRRNAPTPAATLTTARSRRGPSVPTATAATAASRQLCPAAPPVPLCPVSARVPCPPQLKVAGTVCREAAGSCDLPEFCTGASPYCPANVYLLDGSSCARGEAYCSNGMCMTHQQQCVQLWGPGAWPAPDACFQDVNMAGNTYGNCGKDSQGRYVKCDKRDAMCGKIQCQSSAKKPQGTNTVSIDTTIRFKGREVKCRGTFVYSAKDDQEDLSDPGLVLTGTKCGDGMGTFSGLSPSSRVHVAPPCSQPALGVAPSPPVDIVSVTPQLLPPGVCRTPGSSQPGHLWALPDVQLCLGHQIVLRALQASSRNRFRVEQPQDLMDEAPSREKIVSQRKQEISARNQRDKPSANWALVSAAPTSQGLWRGPVELREGRGWWRTGKKGCVPEGAGCGDTAFPVWHFNSEIFFGKAKMVCKDRRCQNASLFELEKCVSRCHGRGVSPAGAAG